MVNFVTAASGLPKRSLMLLMDRDRTKLKTRRLDQAIRQLQKHSAVRVLAPDDSHVLLARKFGVRGFHHSGVAYGHG